MFLELDIARGIFGILIFTVQAWDFDARVFNARVWFEWFYGFRVGQGSAGKHGFDR